MAQGLVVAGELDRASGLGESARLILHALETLGVPCWPMRPGGPIPPAHVPLLVVGTAPSMPLDLMRLGRERVRGRRVIGYWHWELPVAPSSWHMLVPFAHEVWAPSRFAAAALSSLVPDVRSVPLPLALRPPTPSARGRASFGLPDDAVVTLVMFNLASSFERKNPLAAITAHRQAFGERGDRILLVHVTDTDHFSSDLAQLKTAAPANVRIQTASLSRADTQALMSCCDIVLSLHRSEGFGLVPAEALLLGKPVIATDWSSTTEFLDAENAALVPAQLIPARDPRGVFEVPGAVWADADVGKASEWLRRLADDPELRRTLGESARRSAQRRLGSDELLAAVNALGAAQ